MTASSTKPTRAAGTQPAALSEKGMVIYMTTAHLADLIIIGCFFGALGGTAGHILGRFVCWVIDKVKAMREKRGKDMTDGDEVEQ